LQQAGYPAAAVQAFSAAVARWPDNAAAFMAFGNALYAVGSLRKATRAFEQAVRIDPGNGDALNNLAHLLAESQDIERAEATARRAVAIGGPHRDIYLQTLNEILLQKH
jgi:Flp pilus assembly protein TadD